MAEATQIRGRRNNHEQMDGSAQEVVKDQKQFLKRHEVNNREGKRPQTN